MWKTITLILFAVSGGLLIYLFFLRFSNPDMTEMRFFLTFYKEIIILLFFTGAGSITAEKTKIRSR